MSETFRKQPSMIPFNDFLLGDFADVPCFLCKPKTLGECRHPIEFADDDYLHDEGLKRMKEFGRNLARERELRAFQLIVNGEVFIDERGRAFVPEPRPLTPPVTATPPDTA